MIRNQKMIKDQKLVDINTKGHTQIVWMVNDICPFHCWYCPEPTWNGQTNQDFTWEQCSHAIDLIQEHYKEGYFLLTGGEPTNWPHYTKVCEKFAKNPKWSIITMTNLSRKIEFIEKYIPHNIAVSCTYHPNVLKTDKQTELFVEKVHAIKDRSIVAVRIMMDPLHFDRALKLYYSLNDPKLFVEAVRISNFIDGYVSNDPKAGEDLEHSYTDEQLAILNTLESKVGPEYQKAAHEIDPLNTTLTYEDGSSDWFNSTESWEAFITLDHHKRNRFKGWHCEIGLNNLYIDPKGGIAKSVCKGARLDMVSSIKDIDNFTWPDRPTVCEFEWCFCHNEALITKRKP